MATDRKRWPRGAEEARQEAIVAILNGRDAGRDAKELLTQAFTALRKQQPQLLELQLFQLRAELSEVLEHLSDAHRLLDMAKHGQE